MQAEIDHQAEEDARESERVMQQAIKEAQELEQRAGRPKPGALRLPGETEQRGIGTGETTPAPEQLGSEQPASADAAVVAEPQSDGPSLR